MRIGPTFHASAFDHRLGLLRAAPFTVLLIACSSLVMTACGGDSVEEGSTTPPVASTVPAAVSAGPEDACALLPVENVAEVLGQPVRDSLALHMPGSEGTVELSQCNYATEQNPAAVSMMLRQLVEGDAADESVRQTFAESGMPVEEVPGLGRTAFFGGNQLHVFTDRDWYLIVTPSASGGLDQARALAEKAMSRL